MKHEVVDNQRVTSDPSVLGGKPCIRGTRISVELILEVLASGGTYESVLASYPHLDREDVSAAIRYAAGAMRGNRVWDVEVPA